MHGRPKANIYLYRRAKARPTPESSVRKQKKREEIPAVEAQFLTNQMLSKRLLLVNNNLRNP